MAEDLRQKIVIVTDDKELKNLITSLGVVTKKGKEAGKETTKAGSKMGSMFAKAKKGAVGLAKALGVSSRILGTIAAGGTVAVIGAIAVALGKALQAAAKFEKQFANVTTLFDTAEISAGAMRAELLALSTRGPLDLLDLTKGLYDLVSAGVAAESAVSVLGVAVKAAVGGVTDADSAIDGLTSAMNAWQISAEGAEGAADSFFVAVRNGKCVTGDTRVLLADGRYERIDSLQNGATVVSWDGRNFTPMRAEWTAQGVKPVVQIGTKLGRSIRTTWAHPYLTPTGWKKVSELEEGDRIAVPTSLPYFGKIEVPEHEAALLGLWVAEGSSKATSPRITSTDYGKEVEAWATEYDCVTTNVERRDGRAPVWQMSTGRTGPRVNPVQDLLREHGLVPTTSGTKHVPKEVFSWDRQSIATFLHWLFNGDGWLTDRSKYDGASGFILGFVSKSERLVRDVNHLLLRFGIVGTVRFKDASNAWFWETRRYDDVRRFVEMIGIDRPDAAMVASYTPTRHQITYDRVIEYTLVKSIEEQPPEPVYDLMVVGLQNFVAEDIVAHNTTFKELSDNIGTLGPIAAATGVSLDEALSGVAAITTAGVRTNQAMTQLRSLLVAVARQVPQTQKVARALGVDFSVTALRAKGLKRFLDDVIDAAKGDETQITKLVGRIEALNAILQLTGSQSDKFAKNLDDMTKKAGSTQVAFSKMRDTAINLRDTIGNQLNKVFVELGLNILPTVNEALQDVSSWIRGLDSPMQQLLYLLEQIEGVSVETKARVQAAATADNIRQELRALRDEMAATPLIISLVAEAKPDGSKPFGMTIGDMDTEIETKDSINLRLKDTTELLDYERALLRLVQERGVAATKAHNLSKTLKGDARKEAQVAEVLREAEVVYYDKELSLVRKLISDKKRIIELARTERELIEFNTDAARLAREERERMLKTLDADAKRIADQMDLDIKGKEGYEIVIIATEAKRKLDALGKAASDKDSSAAAEIAKTIANYRQLANELEIGNMTAYKAWRAQMEADAKRHLEAKKGLDKIRRDLEKMSSPEFVKEVERDIVNLEGKLEGVTELIREFKEVAAARDLDPNMPSLWDPEDDITKNYNAAVETQSALTAMIAQKEAFRKAMLDMAAGITAAMEGDGEEMTLRFTAALELDPAYQAEALLLAVKESVKRAEDMIAAADLKVKTVIDSDLTSPVLDDQLARLHRDVTVAARGMLMDMTSVISQWFGDQARESEGVLLEALLSLGESASAVELWLADLEAEIDRQMANGEIALVMGEIDAEQFEADLKEAALEGLTALKEWLETLPEEKRSLGHLQMIVDVIRHLTSEAKKAETALGKFADNAGAIGDLADAFSRLATAIFGSASGMVAAFQAASILANGLGDVAAAQDKLNKARAAAATADGSPVTLGTKLGPAVAAIAAVTTVHTFVTGLMQASADRRKQHLEEVRSMAQLAVSLQRNTAQLEKAAASNIYGGIVGGGAKGEQFDDLSSNVASLDAARIANAWWDSHLSSFDLAGNLGQPDASWYREVERIVGLLQGIEDLDIEGVSGLEDIFRKSLAANDRQIGVAINEALDPVRGVVGFGGYSHGEASPSFEGAMALFEGLSGLGQENPIDALRESLAFLSDVDLGPVMNALVDDFARFDLSTDAGVTAFLESIADLKRSILEGTVDEDIFDEMRPAEMDQLLSMWMGALQSSATALKDWVQGVTDALGVFTGLLGKEGVEAFQFFIDRLLKDSEGLTVKMRTVLRIARGIDLTTQAGQTQLDAITDAIGESILAGTTEQVYGLSEEDALKIANNLKGLGEAAFDGNFSASVGIARTITEIQGNEVLILLNEISHWSRLLYESVSGNVVGPDSLTAGSVSATPPSLDAAIASLNAILGAASDGGALINQTINLQNKFDINVAIQSSVDDALAEMDKRVRARVHQVFPVR